MKRIIVSAILFAMSFATFAQENDISTTAGNNELKINMSNLIFFKAVDFNYEYIMSEESSVGVNLLFTINDSKTNLDEYRSFSLTPYYRHFFSNKYAEGFFVEAFTMIHSGTDENNGGSSTYIDKKYTDLAVGVSGGWKVVSRRGFVAEVYLGIGRDLLGKSNVEVVTRGGLSIGYRF